MTWRGAKVSRRRAKVGRQNVQARIYLNVLMIQGSDAMRTMQIDMVLYGRQELDTYAQTITVL